MTNDLEPYSRKALLAKDRQNCRGALVRVRLDVLAPSARALWFMAIRTFARMHGTCQSPPCRG